MKFEEVPKVETPVAPYTLALQTAEKMGEFDMKEDDYREWTGKAEKLIGEDIVLGKAIVRFFDTKVRDWCTQVVLQERINTIVFKLEQLFQMKIGADQTDIRLEITQEINLLWLSEEKLRKEVKKRKLGQMFLMGGIVVGLSAITIGKIGMENAKNIQFPFYELQVEGLPDSLCGTSIVHLTDLHADDGLMGNPIDSESVVKIRKDLIEKLNEQNLDLNKVFVTITGDMFSEGASNKEIVAIAKELGLFPGKKFFVLGNHDVRHKDTEFIVSELEKNNVLQLDAQGVNEGGIELQGLPDATTQADLYTPDILLEIKKEPKGDLRIVLNHDLTSIDSLLPQMTHTLILSGHTHGGQIAVLSGKWKDWFYKMIDFEYQARIFSGIEQINKNTVAEVSNGAGVHTLPVRFNASPEIPIIILDALKELPVEKSKNGIRENIKKIFTFRDN